MLEPSERIGVDNTVPVKLKGGSNIAGERFVMPSAGICAQGSVFGKKAFFPDLEQFPDRPGGYIFNGRGDGFLFSFHNFLLIVY